MSTFIDYAKAGRKAIAGFITPAVPLLLIAIGDASPGGTAITQAELIPMVVVCVSTSLTVFAVTNKPVPVPAPVDEAPANGADEEDDVVDEDQPALDLAPQE